MDDAALTRDVSALTSEVFDLVVIGGGIFGVCAAYDAAQRGLRVAIVERGDFGGATSANSLKMVHGGIRYIQHLDVARIRHSAHERRAFLKVAPHLVRPLPILIPTYGHGMKGKGVLRIGMALFDLMTADCNRGIAAKTRKIPWCDSVSRKRMLEVLPGVKTEGLTGAARFSDGQMFNPCRLVLAFLQSAVREGAVAANYVRADGLLRDDKTITGIRAVDDVTKKPLEIRSKVVLNAAGPYAQKMLASVDPALALPHKIDFSRDTAFVVNRKLTDGVHAVALQGETHDPDAKLSRGARHMFIAPWRDYTLVGVWHGVHRDDPDNVDVTEAELQSYLDEINAIYPAWNLTLDDINLCNAGLVPFGENSEDAKDLRYGHRSHLIDHAECHDLENLLTLIGVRYTTGRFEAVHAVDAVYKKLGRQAPKSRSDEQPLVGGDVSDFDAALVVMQQQYIDTLGPAVIASLMHQYGTGCSAVLDRLDANSELAKSIGGSATIAAQVVHAVEAEMARTLGDIVFRRTDLASGAYPGERALRQVAALVAGPLDWDPARVDREVSEVQARFPKRVLERVDGKPETHKQAVA
ncbi:glycerol-3-phosphate dehydrogenase/oxidase [Phycisphaeraceae bacterium D3-23]